MQADFERYQKVNAIDATKTQELIQRIQADVGNLRQGGSVHKTPALIGEPMISAPSEPSLIT